MKTILPLLLVVVIPSLAQEDDGDFHLDKEYAVAESGTLRLNSSDAKVFITGFTDRTQAHVKIDRKVSSSGLVLGNRYFDVKIKEANGNLEIVEDRHSSGVMIVGSWHENYTITIELPAGMSLDIRGDDGDYQVSNIHGAVAMNVDDADVTLIGCKGSSFRFRIDDGDINMDEGKGILEVEGDDADVEIRNAAFSSIDAELDDGDFVVETSLDPTGNYAIDLQDGMVGLTILKGGGKFDVRHDDARVVADSEFENIEKSEDRTRLVLGDGSARVMIRADDARVRLSKN